MSKSSGFDEFKKTLEEFSITMETVADVIDEQGHKNNMHIFLEDTKKMREGMMLFQAGVDSMINKIERFQELEDLMSRNWE